MIQSLSNFRARNATALYHDCAARQLFGTYLSTSCKYVPLHTISPGAPASVPLTHHLPRCSCKRVPLHTISPGAPSPQPLVTVTPFSVLTSLPLPDSTYVMSDSACFLRAASLSTVAPGPSSLKVAGLPSPPADCIPLCVCVFSVCSSVDRHVGCARILVVVSDTAVNTGLQVSF